MKKAFITSNTFKTVGYKALIFGTALFILSVMQTTVFARISLFGAIPDLMLAATLTLAMHDGEKTGAVSGIAAGFFYVAIGSISSPLYILFAFLCGYILGIISSITLSKNYPSFLVLASFAYLAKGIFNVIDVSLCAQSFDLISALSDVAVPELFCSLIFCSPIYFAFYALTLIFNRNHTNRKDLKPDEFK